MKSFQLSALLAVLLFTTTTAITAAPVNINIAPASDIAESLTGVGMSKAQAIVKYRQQNGDFKTAADIVQVKGIGQSILEKNKDDILIK